MIRSIRRAAPGLPPLGEDRRGLALVEFAIALPVMLLLYLGGWQLSDAIACNRKVTITARATADLVSQYASIPASGVQSIIAASTQIMAPYDATNAAIVVSQLCTDGLGVTRVSWSQAGPSATARTPNSIFALPPSMISLNTCLIYGEVRYRYSPIVLYGLSGPITLADAVYMSPRISTTVTLS